MLGINELRRNPTPASLSSTSPPRKKIDKVLYIDLDVHHGDGVELSFAGSKKVRTLSIHLHAPLFFPSTGALSGSLNGPLNIAVHQGLSDASLLRLVENVVLPVLARIDPDAVVLQLGVDGLAGDPVVNESNLSLSGLGQAVRDILACCQDRKVLMLGGGGYHSANAARAWTYFTSIAVRQSSFTEGKATDIPSAARTRYFPRYRDTALCRRLHSVRSVVYAQRGERQPTRPEHGGEIGIDGGRVCCISVVK